MLTPVDIENKEFGKAFRGYDIYEVEEFMKTIVTDYERIYRENANLKEKNAMLAETIQNYKGMEETMQNAIIVAQRTAEDIKKNAYERAENILTEARGRANEAIANADKTIGDLEKTFLGIQGDMDTFRARMSALLTTYMKLLEDVPSYEVKHIERPFEENVVAQNEDNKQEPVIPQRMDIENEPVKQYAAREIKTEEVPEEQIYTGRTANPVIEQLMKERAQEKVSEDTRPVQPVQAAQAVRQEEEPQQIEKTEQSLKEKNPGTVTEADLEALRPQEPPKKMFARQGEQDADLEEIAKQEEPAFGHDFNKELVFEVKKQTVDTGAKEKEITLNLDKGEGDSTEYFDVFKDDSL